MTREQAKQLSHGDVVFWTDPDAGLCSRTMKIASVIVADRYVWITDKDGDEIQCYPSELELTKGQD